MGSHGTDVARESAQRHESVRSREPTSRYDRMVFTMGADERFDCSCPFPDGRSMGSSLANERA